MLPRHSRLPIGEFPRKSEKKIVSPLFTVKIAPNPGPFNRFGVIISSSTLNSSVKRHRVRRIIYALASKYKEGVVDLLFIGSPKLKDASDPEIRYSVLEILNKIK